MRVRFVGGALSTLLIVCLITAYPSVRVQAYNSESDEVDYIESDTSGSRKGEVIIENNDSNTDKNTSSNNKIIAEPLTPSEIIRNNKNNDANIREAGKLGVNQAQEQLIPVSSSSSISKREKIYGLPQEAYQELQDQAISPPLNSPSDLKQRVGLTTSLDVPEDKSGSAVEATADAIAAEIPGAVNAAQSQARAFGSNLFSGQAKPINIAQQQEQQQPEVVGQQGAVAHEDLPTIIENNQQVELPGVKQLAGDKQSAAVYSNSSSSSLPSSSARTFDSWTNCIGSTSNKYGTCKNDVECEKHKGKADGSCMGGLGVCCVMALSCNDKSIENNTFFANPDFPEPSWEARQCQVELTKKGSSVVQIMIEFDEFELAPPNADGECITDVFQIRLASNKPSPYSQIRICGHNTGQHLYLDVSQIDEPLVLSIATSGGGFPRRWSIRIVQMDMKNHLLAPPGCLQYYTDTVGHFRSFNLGKNLRNLYYAICFRIDNGYSGIRFTSNFFGMNGPLCRKRIGGKQLAPGGLTAHPHHLVIPPPGSAIPLPRPAASYGQQQQYQAPLVLPAQQTYQQQPAVYPQQAAVYQLKPATIGPKFKRQAPGQTPTQPIQQQQQQQQQQQVAAGSRTLSHLPGFGLFGSGGDKEAKLESKEFEKHEKYQPYPHPPPPGYGYSQSPYFPPTYGPPPQIIYGGEPGKHGLGGEKFPLGKEEKFGYKSDDEIKYGAEEGYGPGVPPPGAYGPPPGYGPQQQAYGPPLDYYHKEIGKFGEKYEHLHEKHEKNHHGKDHEKGTSSWWPNFGFKGGKDKQNTKDKEKFFMHHEALFPLVRMPEMPHCDPRYCGVNDVITFPPSGDSIAEMCGNSFNRGRGPKIISGSPLVVYVSNRGALRGSGFDMNYEQVFYIPKPY